MKNFEKEIKNHMCRFNDGECVCECFVEGYRKGIEHGKNVLNTCKDLTHYVKVKEEIKRLNK